MKHGRMNSLNRTVRTPGLKPPERNGVLDEAFKMPAARIERDDSALQKNIIDEYLREEIIDTADQAVKSFTETNDIFMGSLICWTDDFDSSFRTFKPFLSTDGTTVTLKTIYRGTAVEINDALSMERLLAYIEAAVKDRLGISVSAVSESNAVRDQIYAVDNTFICVTDDTDSAKSFVTPADYPVINHTNRSLNGFKLLYDGGLGENLLSGYKDFISKRAANPRETDVTLSCSTLTHTDKAYVNVMRTMFSELSRMSAEELGSGPHRFRYIDLSYSVWAYASADLKFIKELRLPLKVITKFEFFGITNSVSYRNRIENTFGIKLTPDEHRSLAACIKYYRGKSVVVDPVEESFIIMTDKGSVIEKDLKGFKWTKDMDISMFDPDKGEVDEAFSMPVKRSPADSSEPEFVHKLKADTVLDTMDEAACGFMTRLAAAGHPYTGTGGTDASDTPLIALKNYGGKYPFTFRPFMAVTEKTDCTRWSLRSCSSRRSCRACCMPWRKCSNPWKPLRAGSACGRVSCASTSSVQLRAVFHSTKRTESSWPTAGTTRTVFQRCWNTWSRPPGSSPGGITTISPRGSI